MTTTRKPSWHFDPQDTDYQRGILRRFKTAQSVRRRFPTGTRVQADRGDLQGTVTRHVPGASADGGQVHVAWDNGLTGKHHAGNLRLPGEKPLAERVQDHFANRRANP